MSTTENGKHPAEGDLEFAGDLLGQVQKRMIDGSYEVVDRILGLVIETLESARTKVRKTSRPARVATPRKRTRKVAEAPPSAHDLPA